MDGNKIKFENSINNGNVNIIDKSKNINVNKNYYINIQDSRINFKDIDSKEHLRSKYENDRPRLEKYYIEGRKGVGFIGFVACKKKNNVIITNIHDNFGKHLASHVVIKDIKLDGFIGKLIKFKGDVYPYKSDSYYEEKYGIKINVDSIEEISIYEHCYCYETPWKEQSKYIDIPVEKFNDLINKFIKSSDSNKKDKLEDIKHYLDAISVSMFGIPSIIYSQILSIFSMKDNLDDVEMNSYNLKHLNILLTFIAEYITGLRPNNYPDMLKIITYSTLVYLGYDILHPADKNAKEHLFESCKYFKISKEQVIYSIKDYMKNVGGYKAIESYIPKHLRYDIFDLPKVARTLFVYRLLDS